MMVEDRRNQSPLASKLEGELSMIDVASSSEAIKLVFDGERETRSCGNL